MWLIALFAFQLVIGIDMWRMGHGPLWLVISQMILFVCVVAIKAYAAWRGDIRERTHGVSIQ